MTTQQSAASKTLTERTGQWLMAQALTDARLEDVVKGACERLYASGIPIARAHMSFSVLHPLFSAVGYTWWRGRGLEVEGYRHSADGTPMAERFLKSPYYHLLNHGLEHIRRRLDTGGGIEFPIFEDLRKEGYTDYLAYAMSFDPERAQGVVGSWSTDQRGGFLDSEIDALLSIQSGLAVACKMALRADVARSVLSTYLGGDAGGRVLMGQIKRGDGETIRAAIVAGDLRESTALAEAVGREGYIEALNEFFDSVAGAMADAGGEILNFAGDGFLAVFPCERHRKESVEATGRAFAAAAEAKLRMEEVNARRAESGKHPLKFGLGLHIGNVMFGNVGLMERLTFSVFGRAVNEAVRLESLNKKYNTTIVASRQFVDYAGGEWEKLGDESLRGLSGTLAVYRPLPGEEAKMKRLASRSVRELGYSDAENVVMLHRRLPPRGAPIVGKMSLAP